MKAYTYETGNETLVVAAENSAVAWRLAREARPNATPKLLGSKDILHSGNVISIQYRVQERFSANNPQR